jgi:hypothetical protein
VGRQQRERPKHLAQKLCTIRKRLGPDFSQNDLIASMGLTGVITQDYISAFEKGKREPPLPILLRYAELAGVCTDVLIDDTLKLPAKLPSKPLHSKAPRATPKKRH